MCSPALAVLALTGVSAYGQTQQGRTEEKIARYNASALDQQAQRVSESGAVAEQTQRMKVQQLLASQTVAAGASGADVSSGSFGDVMDDTAVFGELDAQTIRMNAGREAWGLKTQGQALRYQGKAAKARGVTGAIGTALTGFASAYGMASQAGTAAGTPGKLKWW